MLRRLKNLLWMKSQTLTITFDSILFHFWLQTCNASSMAYIENNNYTLSEVINLLKAEGYTEDFNLPTSCTAFHDDPSQFIIENTFRFDNQSDPDDQSVLYAVCCKKRSIKGILLNSYGLYNEPVTSEIIAKIHTDYTGENAPQMSDRFERRLDKASENSLSIERF